MYKCSKQFKKKEKTFTITIENGCCCLCFVYFFFSILFYDYANFLWKRLTFMYCIIIMIRVILFGIVRCIHFFVLSYFYVHLIPVTILLWQFAKWSDGIVFFFSASVDYCKCSMIVDLFDILIGKRENISQARI